MEAVFDYFFCALCGQDCPFNEILCLNGFCTCVFCRTCLESHVTHQLDILTLQNTRDGFHSRYRASRQANYIDDEGAKVKAIVWDADYQQHPEDAEIELQFESGTTMKTPYWRVTFPDDIDCSFSPLGCFFVPCPAEGCHGVISKTDISEMFPEAYSLFLENASITRAILEGCIRCPYPNCGCLIERIPTNQEFDPPSGEKHSEYFRFRCAECTRDFCGVCLAKPYHAGYNCLQFKMPNCRYCQEKLDPNQDISLAAQTLQRLSMTETKQLIDAAEADYSWCLERQDFAFVAEIVKSVCHREACRSLLRKSCTKQLPCGHGCVGVRNDPAFPTYRHQCMACFESECPSSGSEYDGCQICWESFNQSPCIQLPCKHLIHLECARERIVQGFPGPSITFNHLNCSMCGASATRGAVQAATAKCSLDHPLLKNETRPILKLREEVSKEAMRRLKATNDIQSPELKPGGEFDGRPIDFALKRYMFYLCSKCKNPYFGGLKDCQAAAEQNAEAFNPEELICGACCANASGDNCSRHGTTYIEWKCRYCCDVACWFCWGTTHMCERCHSSSNRRTKACAKENCPLKIKHPVPGTEFCLGCSLCRHRDA